MDPLETETARFWENHGDKNPSDPSKIATEVFLLPTTCFAEEDGSLTNSSRWLQWHWKAADAPGEAKSDIAIMSGLFQRMRAMYQKDGGAFPDPILNLTWNYTNPIEPGPDELAKEVNGRALVEVKDARPATVLLRAGQQLDASRSCATTAPPRAAAGSTPAAGPRRGNMMARRDATDPREQGLAPNWAFAWPVNRRIMYNRASADPSGKPWNPAKPLIQWNGTRVDRHRRAGLRCRPSKPEAGVGPFIMLAGRHGAAVRARPDARGSVPRALRAVRKPGAESAASEGERQPGGTRVRRTIAPISARRTSSPMSAPPIA